jgi:hypothetical protein
LNCMSELKIRVSSGRPPPVRAVPKEKVGYKKKNYFILCAIQLSN